jgi:hypothetical protein
VSEHEWSVGDRVVWEHREGNGPARRTVRSPGTVVAVNLDGLPKGVKVQFDAPFNGVMDCYATHYELKDRFELVPL